MLRDALETPGARAALVTPDRALAGRVCAELLRFGVVADDSAGEALGETPPAVFLRLLAGAAEAELRAGAAAGAPQAPALRRRPRPAGRAGRRHGRSSLPSCAARGRRPASPRSRRPPGTSMATPTSSAD